tara:strand:- start:3619 stop:3900 length:282 start_codon:yes stop_codon:yes gene_type:complete
MPRINLIGASNLHTNNTCQFGSMAGLAPTKNVRPWISAKNGYKYNKTLNDPKNYVLGCGSNRSCGDGRKCLQSLGLYKGVHQRFDTVRGRVLG